MVAHHGEDLDGQYRQLDLGADPARRDRHRAVQDVAAASRSARSRRRPALAAEKTAQYAAHTERLEARVRVLEQIVTDGGVQTAAQIEALRPARLSGEKSA